MSNLLELTNLHKLTKYVVFPAIDPNDHIAQALSQLWEKVDLNQALSSLHNVSDGSTARYLEQNIAHDLILTHNPNLAIGENCFSQEFLQQPYAELFVQVRGFNVSWLCHNYYFVWQAYRSQVISEHNLTPLLEILPPALTLDCVLETLVMSGVLGLGQLCANFDSVMDDSKLAETDIDLYSAILSRLNTVIFNLDLQAQAQLLSQAYHWASFNHYLKASGEAHYDQVLAYLQSQLGHVGNLVELQRLALFFDQFKAFHTGIRLPITKALINQAVTYHQLYLTINQNSNIGSNDYVLISNGNVHLVPDWRIRLSQLIQAIPQLDGQLGQPDLVQLMHTLEPRVSNYHLKIVSNPDSLIPTYSISNKLVLKDLNDKDTTRSYNCDKTREQHQDKTIDPTKESLSTPVLSLSYASIKDYKQHYQITHSSTLTRQIATTDPKDNLVASQASLGSAYVQAGRSNNFDQYFLEHASLAHQKVQVSAFRAFDEYVKYLSAKSLHSTNRIAHIQALGQLGHLRHLSVADLEQILDYYQQLPSILTYAQLANERMYQQFVQAVSTPQSIYNSVDQASAKKVLSGYGLREYPANYTEGLTTTPLWGLPSHSRKQVFNRMLNYAKPKQTNNDKVTKQQSLATNLVKPNQNIDLNSYSRNYLPVFAHNYYQSHLQDLYINRRYLDLLNLPTINLKEFNDYTVYKSLRDKVKASNLELQQLAFKDQVEDQNKNNDTDQLVNYVDLSPYTTSLQLTSQVIALSSQQLQQTGLSYQILTPINLFYQPQLAVSFTISGEVLGQAIPNFCSQTLYYLDRNNFSSGDLFLLKKSALLKNLVEQISFTASQYYGHTIDLDLAKVVHLTPSLGYTSHQNNIAYLKQSALQRLVLEQSFSLDVDYQHQTLSLGYDYVACYRQYVLAYTPNFNASLSIDGRLSNQDIASYTEQQAYSPYYQDFSSFYQQAPAQGFKLFSPQLPTAKSLWEQEQFNNQQQLYKTVQDLIQVVFCAVSGISSYAQTLDLTKLELNQNLVRKVLTEVIDNHINALTIKGSSPVLTTELVKAQVQSCYLAIKDLAQSLVNATSKELELYRADYHQRFDLATVVNLALSLSVQEWEEVCLQLVSLVQDQAHVRDFKLTDNVSPSFNHYIDLAKLASPTLIKLHAYQQIIKKVVADPSIISTDYVILADINYKFAPHWKFKLNRLFSYLHNLSGQDATLDQYKAVLLFKFNPQTEDLDQTLNNRISSNDNSYCHDSTSSLLSSNTISYYLPQLDESSLDYLQNLPCYASSLVQEQLACLGSSLSLHTLQVPLSHIFTNNCIAITKEHFTSSIWQNFMDLSVDQLASLAQLLEQNQTHDQFDMEETLSESDSVKFALDKSQSILLVIDGL